MSSEITINSRLQVTKGNLILDRNLVAKKSDMSGTRLSSVIQSIGTTYEAVEVSTGVGTAGWSYIRNNDSTNFVEVGVEVSAAFYPFLKLKAGEGCVARVATDTLFAKANTGPCDVEFTVLED